MRRPQLDRQARQVLPGELRVAAAEGDDPRREGADVSGLRPAAQRVGHGDRHRCPPLRHVRADLSHDRLGQRATAAQDLDDPCLLGSAVRRFCCRFGGVPVTTAAGGRARRAGRPSP